MNADALAARVDAIGLSPVMKTAIEAERMRREGKDVVDLGAGEPDFPTPPHIVAAAKAALDAGRTKYTANMGVRELREAIAERYRADCGVSYTPDEVIATAGGKQALFHAAMALFGVGDEVVVHRPGWPTLAEQVRLAGGTPVPVMADPAKGFALTADLFIQAFTPRTRGVILNTPANPTGALMSEAEAGKLAREATRRGIWIVIDLCYEGIVYERPAPNLLRVFSEQMRDRFVVCGSVSKAYAMTGWRLGWMVGPPAVVRAANALQSHETSNPNSIAQWAATAALTGPQQAVLDMCAEYEARRDLVLQWLSEEPRLSVTAPRGAFYVFPSVGAFLTGTGCATSVEFAARLLAEEHVVVAAGEAFDAPGYVRLSYAASRDRLREGITRLIRFARALPRPV